MGYWDEDAGCDADNSPPSSRSREFVVNVLGEFGWDSVSVAGSSVCSGELSDFRSAVNSLKYQLEAGILTADTDDEIIGLSRMTSKRWARYIDPAFSSGVSETRLRSLVVLYECDEHVCTLTQPDEAGHWEAYMGPEAMYALRTSPHLLVPWDDQVRVEPTEPDVFDAPQHPLSDDLTSEDDENRRRHLSGHNVDPKFRESVFAALGLPYSAARNPDWRTEQPVGQDYYPDEPAWRCNEHDTRFCPVCWWALP